MTRYLNGKVPDGIDASRLAELIVRSQRTPGSGVDERRRPLLNDGDGNLFDGYA